MHIHSKLPLIAWFNQYSKTEQFQNIAEIALTFSHFCVLEGLFSHFAISE